MEQDGTPDAVRFLHEPAPRQRKRQKLQGEKDGRVFYSFVYGAFSEAMIISPTFWALPPRL
jgi:hypothetical protein